MEMYLQINISDCKLRSASQGIGFAFWTLHNDSEEKSFLWLGFTHLTSAT